MAPLTRKNKILITNWNPRLLTRRPRIWLMAADSLRVHSSMTDWRISFMKIMKAFSGFLMWLRFALASAKGKAVWTMKLPWRRLLQKKFTEFEEFLNQTLKTFHFQCKIVACKIIAYYIERSKNTWGWLYSLGSQWHQIRTGNDMKASGNERSYEYK